MKRFVSTAVIIIGALSLLAAREPDQKNMLTTDIGYGQRFPLTDLVWPANHGDADVCLWADDKIAAVSLGVDDNTVPDHAWWLEMAEKYDFKMTWWVVTDWLESEANVGFYGTYEKFQILQDAGHELGSHSWNHDCDYPASEEAYWDEQMRVSNGHLETGISGLGRVKTYAGPCGILPSADTTAKYYLSARGTTGGINAANKTVYYRTKVMGGVYNPADQLSKTSTGNWWWSYRGWRVMFTHYMQGANDQKEQDWLVPIQAKRDSLWLGRYCDVAQYGQSRDTHTLNVTSVAADLITFSLTDSMNDTLFTYPLTVKVRLNNDWDTCIATQNGSGIEASVIEHDGNKYALVKAVPDQGEVTLSKVDVSMVSTPVITPDGGSSICSVQVSISCADAGASIYFTIDGSDPDTTAALYTGPVTLSDDATVKAKAYNGTDMPSRVASAAFTVTTQVEDVVISPAGGSHDDSVTVTISCDTDGAVIRYTTDGSEPDEISDAYADGIVLTADATVKAKAFHGCLTASGTAEESFTIVPTSSIAVNPRQTLPGSIGEPMYFDCHGQALGSVPAVPGVYFVYDGVSLTKTLIVE